MKKKRLRSGDGWLPARFPSECTSVALSLVFFFFDSYCKKIANVSLWVNDRYDVALLYLEQAEYDLDAAVNTYLTDELWEKEHPLAPASGGKLKQKLSGRRFGINFGVPS